METISVTRPGEGSHFLIGSDVATLRASSRQTGGRMLVVETVVPRGGGPPVMHRHEYAEVFSIIDGVFEVSTVDEDMRLRTMAASAGDIVSIPSMVWHNFKNISASEGRLIAIHDRAVMEGFMIELGQPIDDPRNLPAPSGPPTEAEQGRMMAIITRYMEVLSPNQIVR